MNPLIRDWQTQTVWIIGGTQGIGWATALKLHALGASVIVSGRHFPSEDLPPDKFVFVSIDVENADETTLTAQRLFSKYPITLVVYSAGVYQPMRATGMDVSVINQHMHINYTGFIPILGICTSHFLAAQSGHISLVSSVAGFYGLPNALAYGPTKAAMTHLAEVLYLDLHTKNIGVSVIHPGFVNTRLTQQNKFKMPALISVEQAAKEIISGWEKGQFEIHFPKRFTFVMKLIGLLPYWLQLKLNAQFQ